MFKIGQAIGKLSNKCLKLRKMEYENFDVSDQWGEKHRN